MIRFENVGIRYGMGEEILRDISFHLEPGSFHFLTGPSGAGKTSLLKLMYLARRPSRGLISMFGHQIANLPRDELQRCGGASVWCSKILGCWSICLPLTMWLCRFALPVKDPKIIARM